MRAGALAELAIALLFGLIFAVHQLVAIAAALFFRCLLAKLSELLQQSGNLCCLPGLPLGEDQVIHGGLILGIIVQDLPRLFGGFFELARL